jgi:transcriptional regulator with XRE-family HTH domain
MSELYNRIAELCQYRGITIAEMCRQSGVKPQNITEIKSGRQAGLSAKNLDKLAKYFGVSASYLLGTDADSVNDDPELTEYLQMLQSRPEFKMLFHTFKSASKAEIEAIVTAWEARNNIKGE